MLEQILIALQAFQVLFLWLHDWIPLGRLNDATAVRRSRHASSSRPRNLDPKRTVHRWTLLQRSLFPPALSWLAR